MWGGFEDPGVQSSLEVVRKGWSMAAPVLSPGPALLLRNQVIGYRMGTSSRVPDGTSFRVASGTRGGSASRGLTRLERLGT